jgi:dipeptidyl aminopeptidase/acylaminoacyl peptidase
MKKTELKDILSYNFLSNLQISDDKKVLAYTSTKANEKENSYDSTLYIVDGEGKKAYKASDNKKISIYDFDQDANLIFKEKSTDDFDIFYKKDLSPAVAEEAFKINKNITSIEYLKDGIFLLRGNDKKSKEEKEKEKEDNAYFKELNMLPFWLNGSGYLKYDNNDVYLYYSKEDRLEKILEGNLDRDINGISFSKDLKKAVYFISTYKNGVMNLREDLYIYDLEKKEEKLLLKDEFSYYGAFFFGEKIVFVGQDTKTNGVNQDPYIYLLNEDGSYEKIVDENFDMDFGVSTGTDARFGSSSTFRQTDDKLFFAVTEKEDSKVYSIDINTREIKLELEGNIEDFALGKDDDIYYFAMGRDHLAQLYLNNDKNLIVGNKIETSTGKIEEFFYESNGDKIRGYVLLPVDFDENKKYPTLLSVHGGPKTELSEIFHHEHQMFANDGYIVIYTNPHGSSGNGIKYSDIRGKYGTIDYQDLMNFTDEAIKRYPQIDKDNMGVYGGSYGGFMTNWIISHTDRFKAANSQRSISNRTSFYGVSDIGYYFSSDQTDANPWDSLEKMWEQSPLKHAGNAKTPTLFIHSDQDYRCPLEQGLQMYSKLKLNGVETKMFVFHDETHELSRSGKPKGRIKRLTEIKKWFDQHLK